MLKEVDGWVGVLMVGWLERSVVRWMGGFLNQYMDR